MPRQIDIPQSVIDYAENIIREKASSSDIIKAVSILLAAKSNLSVDKISEIFQINRRTFFRYRDEFIKRADKPDEVLKKSWGGRRHMYLTQEEEIKFLGQFVKEAKKGTFVSASLIHETLIKYIGKKVSLSTTTRLLERNGWRKVLPDAIEAKIDDKLQKNLKKDHLQSVWLPPLKK
ncbi:MAG: hypothetical protein LBD17_02105 [Endomicrobium sp.]|jgi:hypothetical protein|nr:hypothetical protein [Endomicrobium sp.]